jgi:hypothetical protein
MDLFGALVDCSLRSGVVLGVPPSLICGRGYIYSKYILTHLLQYLLLNGLLSVGFMILGLSFEGCHEGGDTGPREGDIISSII